MAQKELSPSSRLKQILKPKFQRVGLTADEALGMTYDQRRAHIENFHGAPMETNDYGNELGVNGQPYILTREKIEKMLDEALS